MSITSISVEPLFEARQVVNILRGLVDCGLGLVHPGTGKILGSDAAGGRVEAQPEVDLEMLLSNGVGVQLWFDESSDVFLSWNRSRLEMFIDGLTVDQANTAALGLSRAVTMVALGDGLVLSIRFDSERG